MTAKATPADRFQAFQAHHGPLESPLADRVLGFVLERNIVRFFEYPHQTSLAVFVADEMKRQAPDVLAILELAADWSADPMKAAERQLREDLDAKAAAEEADRKRREDAALQAAVKAKADAFMEQLKGGAVVLA